MEDYYEKKYKQIDNRPVYKAKSTDKVVFKNLSSKSTSSIQEYLSIEPLGCIENFNLINYWVNMRESPLRDFALDVITIPGTNASIERMFSVSALVEDKKRLKLKSESKTEIVCLHSWLNCEFLNEY